MCIVSNVFPYQTFRSAEDMEAFARIHCGHFVPVKIGNASVKSFNGNSTSYYNFEHDAIKPLQM